MERRAGAHGVADLVHDNFALAEYLVEGTESMAHVHGHMFTGTDFGYFYKNSIV